MDLRAVTVREWLASLDRLHLAGDAFDPRLQGPVLFTGRASKGIRRSLSHHGVDVVAHPESFLVDKSGELLPGEAARARAWGAQLTWADCLEGIVEHRGATRT